MPPPRRRLTAALVVVLLTGALLTACSGGSSRDTAATKPLHGGVLRVGVVGLANLDPTRGENPASALAASLLFQPLVGLDPVTSNPVPGLARAWHANPTATVFTFDLRADARFHDGTPVTAADVKATIDRVRAPGSGSPFAGILAVVHDGRSGRAHRRRDDDTPVRGAARRLLATGPGHRAARARREP